uniref:Tail protein n=1 Tax=Pantoea phage Survivor TaxID=3232176 RepID=A0AAU8KXP8_9CAUD
MTTLKQSLAIDGQAISNLDPELVITLDAHPSVQISNKTESTITYSFIGAVTKDATYTLNLTFVYKGIHKLVMPLTFEQTVNDPILKVTNIPKSVKIWDEGSDIPFTVFYGPEPGEDITESISDIVITANDSIEGLGGPKWRVKGASTVEPTVRDTEYAFNVTHGDDTFAIKALATFNIARWDGVWFKVEPISFPLECTVGMDTVIYFKPTYMGKYEKGARITPIDGTNRRGITIVKQEDDDENERLAVTIRGASAGMQFYNQFIFQRGAPGGYSSVQWMYVDVYAKAVTAAVSPSRTDTKLGDISKLDITNIRIGHEKVDLLDPRVKFSSSSNNSFSRLSVEKDKAWFFNNNSGGFVNVSIYIDATGYTQFSKVVPMYTIAGTTTGNTLNVKDPSEVLPAQHNVQTFTLVDGQVSLNKPAPAGLKLIGKLDVVMNGNKPVLKLYDDFALTDTPVTGSGSFSMDNGHSGNNITLGGLFEDATGKQWALRNAVFQIPQSSMLMSQVVPGPIDAPNTDQQVINMKVEQLQFDKQLVQLNNVLFGGLSVSGEASAIGTITSKGDGTYLIPITPTGNSGDAVIKGQITYEGVAYAFTSTITFKDVADVKVVSKPLNVKVFDVGSDVPFAVMVDGVDKTQEITNLKFTPTANVIAYNDLGAWEIWDAPNAGVTEKVNYTFDLLVEGETKSLAFDGSFVIGAWDGVMLKVVQKQNEIDSNISGVTGRNTTFKFWATYRGKPNTDLVRLDPPALTPVGNGKWTIISQVPSEDGSVTVTIRPDGQNRLNGDFKYKVSGKPGVTDKKDVVSIYVTTFIASGNGIRLTDGGPWFPNSVGFNTIANYSPEIYVDGERLTANDKRFSVGYNPGNSAVPIALKHVGADKTRWYAQVMSNYAGITQSRYTEMTLTFIDGARVYVEKVNVWLNYSYSTSGKTLNGTQLTTPIASTDNTIELSFKTSSNETVTSFKQVADTSLTVIGRPNDGNALIEKGIEILPHSTKANTWVINSKNGHTGDGFTVEGLFNATPGGLCVLNQFLINVPKAEVVAEPWQESYSAKPNVSVDVVFDLNMLHYNQAEADLSKIVFKTINVTGNANGTTLPVNVAANTFKTPITIPGLTGTASITGTFTEKDAPTIEYGFSMTFETIQRPEFDELQLSADFVTAIEGDSRNTVTVKQSTILPTE